MPETVKYWTLALLNQTKWLLWTKINIFNPLPSIIFPSCQFHTVSVTKTSRKATLTSEIERGIWNCLTFLCSERGLSEVILQEECNKIPVTSVQLIDKVLFFLYTIFLIEGNLQLRTFALRFIIKTRLYILTNVLLNKKGVGIALTTIEKVLIQGFYSKLPSSEITIVVVNPFREYQTLRLDSSNFLSRQPKFKILLCTCDSSQ